MDHSNNGTQLDVVLVTDRRGDLAAIGTTVRAVGVDQVRIKVGVRNVGSASVNFQPPSQDQHPVVAYISLPGNTFGLRAPYDCAGAGAGPDGWAWEDPGRPSSRYACIRGVPLRPGDTAWIELTVTVNRNAPNRPGTIETTRGENVANNKANIVVLTTAADLPITGPRTALTISLGAGALLAGALTMLATSRRRNRDHRPQPSR